MHSACGQILDLGGVASRHGRRNEVSARAGTERTDDDAGDETEERLKSKSYDAIVVGARCAGAPTAMLLAQKGHRVLLVDRATFPSDTVSTHFMHAPGVAALARWQLRDALARSGCPPVRTYRFDFGPFTIEGSPRAIDGVSEAYCPRRPVLDTMLVHAAADAGVEVREAFSVDEILVEDGAAIGIRGKGGGPRAVTEHAEVLIGADGRNSSVVQAVQPEQYNEKPSVSPAFYSYWSGVGSSGFEVYVGDRCGMAAFPTHDDLTLVIVGLPEEDFNAARSDVEGKFLSVVESAPSLAARVRSGTREERFHAATNLAGYFRKPYGPGWALVGDAGYHLHPITAMGISDAFADAERLAEALDAFFTGRSSYEAALSGYQAERDERAVPMYEMTFQLAQLDEPPPAEMQQLLGAVAGNQEAMDDFVSVQAGTLPIPVFFSPENIGRILAA
jgi:2-polyprenyl-6-methoxyphenol hydroxylase-like FAD-dependent oxidoreductase